MNRNHYTRPPRPGPECESFAPLLALAGQEHLTPGDSSALRAHLATCDYCQRERDAYHRLDSALQRHFGPPAQLPLSPDDIAQMMSEEEPMHTRRSDPPQGAIMLLDDRPHHPAPDQPPPQRHQRPQRRRGIIISAISAVAAVLIIALISAALFASGWHVLTGHPKTPTATQHVAPTATSSPYRPNPKDAFNSIAMISPNEGWIVGSNGSNSHPGPLILHYLNGRLFQANVAAPPAGWPTALSLKQVVMTSATDGWAVGPDEGLCSSSLLLHYTSGQWKLDSTMTGTTLGGFSMLSPTDGWAVGTQEACGQGTYTPVLFHYNGKNWTSVQLPADVIQVGQVVMTSATDGWAIGEKQASGSAGNPNLLLHYDGQTWSEVDSTGLAQSGPVFPLYLSDIAMISATDGWLVGTIPGPNGVSAGALLFHYDGKQWSKVNTPLDAIQGGQVTSLSLASDGAGWLAGNIRGNQSFFLQLSGGTWKQVDSPTGEFVSQVFTFSANDAWAIGPGIGQGQLFLLHYHNGAWENVPL
jgi:hypothetical protein